MVWYRPISCDHTVSNPLVCEKSNFSQYNYFGWGKGTVENHFYQGHAIIEWPDDVRLSTEKADNDGIPDDVLQTAWPIPIFSERLVDAIQGQKLTGFQFLPITVLHFNGESAGAFYIANCTEMYAAFNFEQSEYFRFPNDFVNPDARGKIVARKFVLEKGKILNADAFRLQEESGAFFVSQSFVDMFRANDFSGYTFQKIKTV